MYTHILRHCGSGEKSKSIAFNLVAKSCQSDISVHAEPNIPQKINFFKNYFQLAHFLTYVRATLKNFMRFGCKIKKFIAF